MFKLSLICLLAAIFCLSQMTFCDKKESKCMKEKCPTELSAYQDALQKGMPECAQKCNEKFPAKDAEEKDSRKKLKDCLKTECDKDKLKEMKEGKKAAKKGNEYKAMKVCKKEKCDKEDDDD